MQAYLLLYTYDMLMANHSKTKIQIIKDVLNKEFEMKDMGSAKRILGMEIIRNRAKKVLVLSQKSYLENVLHRFNMHKSKNMATPLGHHFQLASSQVPATDEEMVEMDGIPYARCVGSIMCGIVCSRSESAHAVSLVSRFMSNPGKRHWEALKWMLRYVKGSVGLGLEFKRQKQVRII